MGPILMAETQELNVWRCCYFNGGLSLLRLMQIKNGLVWYP